MKKRKGGFNIQSIIMSVLMASTLITITIMGLLLYYRFKLAMDNTAVSNTEATVESSVDRLNSDLLDIRQIFNAANYNIIQEFDISSQEFAKQFSLLYETNSDKIQSMALYGSDGNLIASEPVSLEKENVEIKNQDWYQNAENAIENIHFSMPHVQNLFQDGTYRYHRVISLSRSVDINDGERPGSGVLLVDMKYSVVENVLKQINESSDGVYYYVCNRDGELLYHPRRAEIDRELFKENSLKAAGYEDGVYEISSGNGKENVIVGSISYTGWKLIGVIPESVQTANINNFRYYIFTTIIILMMLLLEGNRLISQKVSKPIRELDASVKAYEAGEKPDIYIGGSLEVRHLGHSVQKSYEQIEQLMEEIMRQQNERRKSELDALQSQINPHFLYNTLETIRMKAVVNHQPEIVELVKMLAKTMRYNIQVTDRLVTLKEELQMVGYYLKIQEYRFGDRIKSELIIDPEVDGKAYILPLTIQPFVENAFVHGLEQKENDGRLTVQVYRKEQEIYIEINDNGCGMDYYELGRLRKTMRDESGDDTHIGVRNVSQRIRILYGSKYGVEVDSTKDLGTKVLIHIPYQTENPQNVELIG